MSRRYGKHKKKHGRRWRRKNIEFAEVRQRFPRLSRKLKDWKKDAILQMHQLRVDYPPPFYDHWWDGSYNPAEWLISWAFNLRREKLDEIMNFHGMTSEGDRFNCIKRLYLHWRASCLGLGFPRAADIPEAPMEYKPKCSCGNKMRISRKIERFPRLKPLKRSSQLFPRLPASSRFWDPIDFEIMLKHRNWYHKKTGEWLDVSEYGVRPPWVLRWPRLK